MSLPFVRFSKGNILVHVASCWKSGSANALHRIILVQLCGFVVLLSESGSYQQKDLNCSGCRNRGVEFKGGSLPDGSGGFGGSGEHLALLLLLLQNTVQRGSRDGFDGFGGFGGDGYPP